MNFINTLKDIWKIEELKGRILVTLGLLLVYRFGAQIALPGIDTAQLGALTSGTENGIFGILNAFTGGAFAKASAISKRLTVPDPSSSAPLYTFPLLSTPT